MKTITIRYPDGSGAGSIVVRPVPFAKLADFNKAMIALTAEWIAQDFSTADLLLNSDTIAAMGEIAQMLPSGANGGKGFSVDLLVKYGDYEQVQDLFFGNPATSFETQEKTVDLSKHPTALLLQLHTFTSKKKIQDALQLLQARTLAGS